MTTQGSNQSRSRRVLLAVVFVCLMGGLLTACGGGGSSGSGSSSSATPASGTPASSGSTGPRTLKVAYLPGWIFFKQPQGEAYYKGLAKELEAKNPGLKVKLEPVLGGYNDIVQKLALLYKDPSTAPDVAEVFNSQMSQLAGTGYLLPLDKYLPSTNWWKGFPANVKSEGTFGGKVFGVNQGENVNVLFYDKPMFKKAGIPLPWQPTSWQDILTTAAKVHAANPSAIPLWLTAGTANGAAGTAAGINNLILGSSTPTIQTQKGDVVGDSPGIRDALGFYKSAYSQGLGAPASQMLAPTGGNSGPLLLPKHKLAICFCHNGYTNGWSKQVDSPYWPQAAADLGVAAIPRKTGGGTITSIVGTDFAVAAHTKVPDDAFKFIDLAQQPKNSVQISILGGLVPPNAKIAASKAFSGFLPPFNKFFAKILPYGTISPNGENYPVWAQGMGEATGALAKDPKGTDVAKAVSTLQSTIQNQSGNPAVTLP